MTGHQVPMLLLLPGGRVDAPYPGPCPRWLTVHTPEGVRRVASAWLAQLLGVTETKPPAWVYAYALASGRLRRLPGGDYEIDVSASAVGA